MKNAGEKGLRPFPDLSELGGCEIEEGLESAHQNEGIAGLPGRVQRYSGAKGQSLPIIAYALENFKLDPSVSSRASQAFGGHLQAAKNMQRCGGYLVFRHYHKPDKVKLRAADFCKQHLICPVCAIRRGVKAAQAYFQKVQALELAGVSGVAQMVTLTVKNRDDLEAAWRHLDRSRKVLTDRMRDARRNARKTAFSGLIAAVGSYEVTNIGNGWHPHIHMWVLADALIDQESLRAEWKAITGDSNQVDVREVYGEPHKAFAEIFKYATKFSDLAPPLVWEVWEKLRGRRLIFSLGELRGVQVPDNLMDDVLEGPWTDYFYHWVAAAGGYSLEGPSLHQWPPRKSKRAV